MPANRNAQKQNRRTLRMFDALPLLIFNEARNAMDKIGEDWVGKSGEAAPILEGHLRRSGQHTLLTAKAAGKLWAGIRVTFGEGVAQAYAEIQHENEDFNHPRGGGPFYVTKPFEANRERYLQALANAARRAVKRARKGGGFTM